MISTNRRTLTSLKQAKIIVCSQYLTATVDERLPYTVRKLTNPFLRRQKKPFTVPPKRNGSASLSWNLMNSCLQPKYKSILMNWEFKSLPKNLPLSRENKRLRKTKNLKIQNRLRINHLLRRLKKPTNQMKRKKKVTLKRKIAHWRIWLGALQMLFT